MSKLKALSSAIVCTLLFAMLLTTNQLICWGPFLLAAMVCGGIWYAKVKRDAKLIETSRAEVRTMAAQLPEPHGMSSNGNDRLFVPDPLDDRR